MHISSNEVSTQNQLTMGEVTHKVIYMLKPFNFIKVEQQPLSYFNTPTTRKVVIYERKNCRKLLQILSLKLFATENCPVVDVADANDLLRQPRRKRYDIFL